MTHEERIVALERQVSELINSVQHLLISTITVTNENNSVVMESLLHARGKGDRLARQMIAVRKAARLKDELQTLKEDYPAVAQMLEGGLT